MRPAGFSWLCLFLLACGCASSFAQDDKVQVESAESAAAKARETAKLLEPPGDSNDNYTPGVIWRDVPPWRQTSFYGVRSQGTFFVFVVDCSGSMAEAERWLNVQDEIRRTLAKMQFPQRYYILFYNDSVLSMPGGLPMSAGKRNVGRTLDWISRIVPEGETDPRGAMAEALALRPHAVYLLSDGEFAQGTAEAIAKSNTAKTPVHTIDLSGGAGAAMLQQIAKDSGGRYVQRQ